MWWVINCPDLCSYNGGDHVEVSVCTGLVLNWTFTSVILSPVKLADCFALYLIYAITIILSMRYVTGSNIFTQEAVCSSHNIHRFSALSIIDGKIQPGRSGWVATAKSWLWIDIRTQLMETSHCHNICGNHRLCLVGDLRCHPLKKEQSLYCRSPVIQYCFNEGKDRGCLHQSHLHTLYVPLLLWMPSWPDGQFPYELWDRILSFQMNLKF